MEKQTIIIIIIAALIAAAAIFFSWMIFSPAEQYTPSTLEQCKAIRDNGLGKSNIVFFAPKETAEQYVENLLEVNPFKENSNEFNFYYIDSYTPKCDIYKGIAIMCYSRELVKKSASCPNDYIVVLDEQPSQIRSSAYMNVMSLNLASPLSVFLHEFGHAFAALADEYVPATLPSSAKNCVSNCDKFPNPSSCFGGCSKENYFRSIDKGIMRTLSSSELGEFNTKLVQDRIEQHKTAITGKAISENTNCEEEEYYLIEGNYTKDNLKIISRTIEKGCLGKNGAGAFNYSLSLQDNSVLSTGEFNAEFVFTDLTENKSISGGPVESAGKFFLKIPVIDKAKELQINAYNLSAFITLENRGAWPCEVRA